MCLVQEASIGRKVGPNLLFFLWTGMFGAIQTFEFLVPKHPDASSTPTYAPYLHLAQLSDENPRLSRWHYQSALAAQNKRKERATGLDSDSDADIKGRIVRVLIGMVEIWMDPSYDLW